MARATPSIVRGHGLDPCDSRATPGDLGLPRPGMLHHPSGWAGHGHGVRPPDSMRKSARLSLESGLRFSNVTTAGTGASGPEVPRSAGAYLRRFFSATPKQKSRMLNKAPLEDLHAVALQHPDPTVRRECLFFLDHYANETSTAVFAKALHDPVDSVRNAALHSIACESCRSAELCVADVVPDIVRVLEVDPSPALRTKAIPTLLRLGGRDGRAWAAIVTAAEEDTDAIVRRAAADALSGRFIAPRKPCERRQRRHDRSAARTATSTEREVARGASTRGDGRE
jgi:hypothetical protein